MNKKTLGRIAAASIAAMTAVSAMGITASAEIGYDAAGAINGTIYQVTITNPQVPDANGVIPPLTKTTVYYINLSDVPQGSNYSVVNVTSVFGYGTNVYVKNGVISKTNSTGSTPLKTTTVGQTVTNPTYGTGYQYASNNNVVYKGSSDGLWYPSLSSMRAAGNTTYSDSITLSGAATYSSVRNTFGTDNVYFNQISAQFEGYAPNVANYIKIVGYENTSNTNYYGYNYGVYKVGSTYYPTYSSALSAAAGVNSYVETIESLSAPRSNYFSRVTGQYYPTYAAALSASRNSSSNVVSLNYYTASNSYYGDYWYDYYGYSYGDPYYYYWLQKQNEKNSDTTTSSKNDTSTATAGNRKGWTAIAKYFSSLKNGSSVSVSMNYETTVPSTVMSAIKGKNITVKFVLKNGVVFTVNGKDVSVASDVNIDTAYNTNMVPSKLVKAAYKKNKAVSSAQITISNGSFGFDADVTVKFATKRAGCTAKLYRYNSSRDTLTLVDTATVQSNGKCTFGDIDKGGNFVITLS